MPRPHGMCLDLVLTPFFFPPIPSGVFWSSTCIFASYFFVCVCLCRDEIHGICLVCSLWSFLCEDMHGMWTCVIHYVSCAQYTVWGHAGLLAYCALLHVRVYNTTGAHCALKTQDCDEFIFMWSLTSAIMDYILGYVTEKQANYEFLMHCIALIQRHVICVCPPTTSTCKLCYYCLATW